MAVITTSFASLLDSLKLEEPWLPPRPWESIPSESGLVQSNASLLFSHSSLSKPLNDTSTVSEASIVRLAMNALQGVESALISIEKLCLAFSSDPADRTFHRVPSLWNRSSSTLALGNILKSIGRSGCITYLLYKFIDYFTKFDFDGDSTGNKKGNPESEKCQSSFESEERGHPPYSLVNQAFAVAVRRVLDGHISALDTLYASVRLRRLSKTDDLYSSSGIGCFTSVDYSEVTLLEVYLHTNELRTQMEALGNICSIYDIALYFTVLPFEDLSAKANWGFSKFTSGGNLLTYLYMQLKVADPVHSALLKFLFLRSFEPYYGFIRSWIYKAEINDPHKEFIVDYVSGVSPCSWVSAGISMNFQLATIREQDGVSIPCFLEDFSVPLFRAGQQLQVLMQVLELCNYVGTWNHTFEDILPCWSSLSSDCPLYVSSLTFNKRWIEEMVLARSTYYKEMMEKLENLLTKSEFRYQQVVANCSKAMNDDNDRHLNILASRVRADSLISPSTANIDHNTSINSDESETSSTKDDSLYVEDPLESLECSSFCSLEEQNGSEQLIHFSDGMLSLEQKYLSALSFSSSITKECSFQKPLETSISYVPRNDSLETCPMMDYFGYFLHSHYGGAGRSDYSRPSMSPEQQSPQTSESKNVDVLHDLVWAPCGLLVDPLYIGRGDRVDTQFDLSDVGLKLYKSQFDVIDEGVSYCNSFVQSEYNAIKKVSNMHQIFYGTHASSNLSASQVWRYEYHSNFFSTNPILARNAFTNLKREHRESCSTYHRELASSFDFTSVKDPCVSCTERLTTGYRLPFSVEPSTFTDNVASAAITMGGYEAYSGNEASRDKRHLPYGCLPSLSKPSNKEDILSEIVAGGSGWESLLDNSHDTAKVDVKNQRMSIVTAVEMPLDFVIRKCLLEEILLQYRYMSKLTIKLLEQVFGLQEHLLALRRYHLMELADWADLFISSLWGHKWYAVETHKRVPEIQAVLALSLQRSSCENDANKDRLYVYMKEQSILSFSTSATGIHTFDLLGLGYRVDWPVSIVLTSDALKIYAEIFTFQVQVKLALLSLNDVRGILKDLMHLIDQSRHSEQHKNEVCHFSVLMKLRHQVNHFVSTLQQYVQSQLSHASWCKFFYSRRHEVKDMMDLESVHMVHLKDSLNICFLSEETRTVASIIEGILQCALDFRSCLVGINLVAEPGGGLPGKVFGSSIFQVLSIRQAFEKKIKELYLCYLRSPRHGEYGIARFWDYLNYNEYYNNFIGKELGHFSFSV